MIDYEHCLQVAITAANKASEIVKRGYENRNKEVETKSDIETNLVTESDKASENMIISVLKQNFPDYKIISEEFHDGEMLTDDPTWIIDPIDGTTNFVHQFPLIGISIGLAYQKKSVLGVIYNPILDLMYYAYKGKGAFLNGKPITVTSIQHLSKSLIATNFPTERQESRLQILWNTVHEYLINNVHGIRTAGSAVMNFAFVAQGSLEGYFERGISSWDMCAGIVLVEEAGGVVCGLDGKPYDLMQKHLVAANNNQILQELLKPIQQNKY